ncbi:hypothetical protein CA54_60550 [Symmachiella macrocystis]|uniref:Uncharacterized protein n=1 Tax=Symmachiella macrocystis TaxID=2527985 RepID=A0A5C6AW67_9PLAN|nr:hypothetical protein CA54_60550 [Symmachiella macrocystis]
MRNPLVCVPVIALATAESDLKVSPSYSKPSSSTFTRTSPPF